MSREAFEKWFVRNDVPGLKDCILEKLSDGVSYKMMVTHQAWIAWQAAESHTVRECDAALEDTDGTCFTCYQACRDAIKRKFPSTFKGKL